MNRLNTLNEQFVPANAAAKGTPTFDVWENMKGDQYMSAEAIRKRKATSKMMDEVYHDLIPYYNKAEMPWFIVPKIQELGINGM